MRGDRKPKDVKRAERSVEPDHAEPDHVESDHAEPDHVEDVPLNRAERRARGKGRTPLPPTGREKFSARQGPAQGPRMWANRRSG